MPSLRAQNMPTVIHAKPSSPKKAGVVFPKDPVASVSRPVNTAESWAAYDFEMHAIKCAYCHDPYEVHRSRNQLCDAGHRLAQEVAKYIYNKSDGATYSTTEEGSKPIRVEVPAGYVQVASLLRAIERSLRHRTRRPFVSMDRSYYVAPRAPALPTRSRSVKVEQEPRARTSRPRSGEIVDWPEKPQSQSKPRIFNEISKAISSKRGSLYEEDLAKQRRNAQRYSVEVREPTQHDLRQHRLSSYYR